MAGAGTSAVGRSPYGIGTPSTAAGNEGDLFSDGKGSVSGSRYLNPYTRQYEYDANGRAKGMPDIQQLVLLALLTELGSSADEDLGLEPPSGVIGANFIQRRKDAITRALSRLVSANRIEVTDIQIDVKNRPVYTIVRWRDLTTSIEHESAL